MGTNIIAYCVGGHAQFVPEEGRHRGDVEEQTGEAECDRKSYKTEAPIAEGHDILLRQGA
jgi:hypothetical protein